MANSFKDIIITPNRGSNTADPNIEFRGGDANANTTITLQTYPTSNGTLSFDGSAGQLFSITNDMSGTIFSVNDVSGIPSIEVLADGQINFAEFGGNVGIGTGSPGAKLQVGGSGAAPTATPTQILMDGTYTNSSTPTNQQLKLSLATISATQAYGFTLDNVAGMWYHAGDSSGSTGNHIFATAGSERMRITSAGNVGIGLTAPASPLHVVGAAGYVGTFDGATDTRVDFRNSGTRNGIIQSTAAVFSLNAVTAIPMTFLTGSTERMRITSAGNVGIGTSTPGSALQVQGLITGTAVTQSFLDTTPSRLTKVGDFGLGAVAVAVTDFTSTELNIGRFFRALSTATAGPGVSAAYVAMPFDGTPGTRFIGVDDTGTLRIGLKAGATATPAWTFAYGPATISDINATTNQIFRVNSTERMRIDSSGNVGIGTTAPATRLHTDVAAGLSNYLLVGGGAVPRARFGYEFSGDPPIDSASTVSADASGNLRLYTRGNLASNIVFYTSNGTAFSERMRITSAGNVGIGQTAPQGVLSILRNISYPNATNSDANAWSNTDKSHIKLESGNSALAIGVDSATNSRLAWLQAGHQSPVFADAVDTSKLALQPLGGNVGIGSAAPTRKLFVATGATADGISLSQQGTERLILLADVANLSAKISSGNVFLDLQSVNSTNRGIRFFTGTTATERMSITSAGDVGIGTTAPTQRLHVQTTGLDQEIALFGNAQAGAVARTALRIGYQTAGYGARIVAEGNASTAFPAALIFERGAGSSSYAESMRITSAGNVGIGTSSPAERLSVSGNIQATNATYNFLGVTSGTVQGQFAANDSGVSVQLRAISNHPLSFFTNNTERARIDSSGNVGIGTSAPSLLFQVSSRGGFASDGQILWGQALTGNNRGALSWNTDVASVNAFANLVFGTNGTTERMRITSAGNVGIGTTAPASRLHVEGAPGVAFELRENTSSAARLNVRQDAGSVVYNATWATGSGNQHIFQVGNVETFRISSLAAVFGDTGTATFTIGGSSAGEKRLRLNNDLWTTGTDLLISSTSKSYGFFNRDRNAWDLLINGTNGAVTISGGITADITGNASTATALQNARNFTIGSTARSFNGTANVSWSLAEIGAADRNLTLTGGDGINTIGNLTANRTISVDSTVIRTTTNQTVEGIKTFSSGLRGGISGRVISMPGGATFAATGSAPVGAFRILLPTAVFNNNTMMSMKIVLYNYATSTTRILHVGGYNFSGPSWVNTFATQENGPSVGDITVRFGRTADRNVIYIGELDSTWSWPQVFVTEFCGGFSGGTNTNWAEGWSIDLTTSAFENVNSTIVASDSNTATTLQTARTINGTSFDGSANITTANWGTARTLTIGATGKSVDGSGNVSWSLAEIGAADRNLTLTGGDGINTIGNLTANRTISVDSTVIRTTGDQSMAGTKTITGTLSFGSVTRQMLNLWSTSYALGVQGNTQYFRSGSRFSWFRGGVHSNTENDPGTGGAVAMTLDNSSRLTVTGDVRSPIFYDSDNTAYYVDPNATTSLRTVGDWRSDSVAWTGEFAGKIQYHNNSWYFQASNSLIFRTATSSNIFSINQTGTVITSGDMRAPIFYDSDNTGFYVDPASTSNLNGLAVAGTITGSVSGNAATATALQTARTIGGVSFNGTANINLPGVNTAGNQNTSGNAATATALQTARTINGVSFNGTANITVADATKLPLAGGTMTGLLVGQTSASTDVNTANDTGGLSLRGTTTTIASMSFHRAGAFAINMGLGTDNVFRIGGWSASANALTLTGTGVLTALADMRAPIFYDSDNTAFYADFASAGADAVYSNGGYSINSGDGKGFRFWNSDIYKIYMSATSNGTWGGRVAGETTSDYNMYFRMTSGTNRGFVFRNNTTNVAGIDASGNGRFIGDVVAFSSSDARLKENLEVIPDALAKVQSLTGYTFNWNDKQNAYEAGKRDVGVIAQDVEVVLPEVVIDRETTGYKAVNYEKLVPLLIEAIKEQQTHINKLETRINSLEGNK